MQATSTWKLALDKGSRPGAIKMTENFMIQSEMVRSLVGGKQGLKDVWDEEYGTEMPKIKKTFKNRSKVFEIDNANNGFNSTSDLNVLAKRYGDEVSGTSDRDVYNATVEAFDMMYAQTFTDEDRMNINDFDSSNTIANWIVQSEKKVPKYFGLNLADQIWNGSAKSGDSTRGSVTNPDLGARDGAIGISTIVGTDELYGLSTSSVERWKGQTYDGGAALFDISEASQQTISGLLTATGKIPILLSIFEKILEDMEGDNYTIWVHPRVWTYLIRPMWEDTYLPSTSGDAKRQGFKDQIGYMPQNWPYIDSPTNGVIKTDRSRIFDKTTGKSQYVMPLNDIWFLNMDDFCLEAHQMKNMQTSKWYSDPTKHGTYIKTTESTFRFYNTNRWRQARYTLDSAVVAQLTGYTSNTTELG